jgi:hypothetical protein
MWNHLTAIAKGRHVDPNDAQPVEKILTELPLSYSLFEIGVRGSDNSHVYALRTGIADWQHFSLLEEAQQLRLDIERQIADLVEE